MMANCSLYSLMYGKPVKGTVRWALDTNQKQQSADYTCMFVYFIELWFFVLYIAISEKPFLVFLHFRDFYCV